jgi:two-component system, sensor histidine kinase
MATPNDGLLGPIAALLQRRRRGARATDPETLDELRGILDAAPAALVAQAPDGQVVAWNRAAARLLGWPKLQADDPLPPFIPPDARSDEAALRARVLAGNEIFRAPGRFLYADGEVLHLLVSAAPRRNAAGKIVGVVNLLEEAPGAGRATFDPPSKSEVMPAQLQGATPARAPSDDARTTGYLSRPMSEPPSRLLAKVSHDLRQPLHALSLLTGALERRVKEPGARDLVNDAAVMVRALQTTFDNLVDLGRLDEGTVQAQPVTLAANDLLSPLAAECAHEAGKSNIIFRHVASSAMVRTDPLLMQRLLRQLLNNALRFAAREDGTRGKVLFGARRRGDRLRLMVADDGIGVPADRQAAIFEPFVQSDEGRAVGGLGLGLAIAARLARLLDAEVRLQSQPGKGSRFWIDVALDPAVR